MTYEFYGDRRPFEHQIHAIKFMLSNKRGYLWLDMGTGKTCTSLWFIDILMDSNKIDKALIVAPLSTIRSVWAQEIRVVCPYRSYSIVHGSPQEKIDALKRQAKIYIINTDGIRTMQEHLAKVPWDVIIVDEVTNFSNHKSKRSKSLQALTAKAKCAYGLSGNPLAGGVDNSYGIAKCINPSKLPTRFFTPYRDLIMYQVNMYEYRPKPGALDVINEVLSPAITYRLEDCVDLPPITYSTRQVDLPKETQKLFKEILDNQIAEYNEGLITAQTASVKMIRLIQITTGFTKIEGGDILRLDIKPKLAELYEIYKEAGNKLVVFAQSVETLHIIDEFFKDKKVHSDLIWGKVPSKSREKIIDHFQSSDEGVLIAQVVTMAHGISLTKSNTLVFFGPIAGNEVYRQAIRRIRRIGQKSHQTIINLVSTKFEEYIFKKLDGQESIALAMLDIYKTGAKDFL